MRKKVVRNEIICPKCGNSLTIDNASENRLLHCTRKTYVVAGRKRRRVTCNFKISAFHGTFFARIQKDLVTVCRFIAYFFMMQPPRQNFLKNELQMSDHDVDWTNFCREVSNTLLSSFLYIYYAIMLRPTYYSCFNNGFNRDKQCSAKKGKLLK